jgi:hypothetical protein
MRLFYGYYEVVRLLRAHATAICQFHAMDELRRTLKVKSKVVFEAPHVSGSIRALA